MLLIDLRAELPAKGNAPPSDIQPFTEPATMPTLPTPPSPGPESPSLPSATEQGISMLMCVYLALFGAAVWALLPRAEQSSLAMAICALPLAAGLWMALRPADERKQRVAENLASLTMPPVLLLFWAELAWPLSLGLTVVHVLAFLAVLMLAGTRLTRVAAAAGRAPVGADVLVQRLGAITTWPGVRITQDSAEHLIVHCTVATEQGARSHRLLLTIDERGAQVRVREHITAQATAPVTEEEANMRPTGALRYAPTTPDASLVWSRAVQTRLIDEAKLARLAIQFEGPLARIPAADGALALDDRVVPMLCALVTRSGYAWRPAFFGG